MTHSESKSETTLPRLEILGSVLLSLLFPLLNGLPVGVGNQSLQMVWMEHLRNPSLFSSDPLIESFAHFPSLFFQVLAWLIPAGMELATALRLLQVLNNALLFLGVTALTRAVFPRTRLALLPLVLLVAGPLSALAETPLPPSAFTHTAFGLSLSVWILVRAFRGSYPQAFLMLGLCANVHLLTAAYTAGILGVFMLLEWRRLPWKPVGAGLAACVLISLPVLLNILNSHAVFDASWLALLRERSAYHVFPSSWWTAGDPAWGLFALWCGLLAWSLSQQPEKHPGSPALSLMLAPAGMMLLGALGSEWIPVPHILRAQLFRSSLFVLLLACIALPGSLENFRRRTPGGLVFSALLLTALCLPPLRVLLPFLLSGLALTAWWRGELRAPHAAVIAVVCCVLTASDLHLGTAFWSLSDFPARIPPVWFRVMAVSGLIILAASASGRLLRYAGAFALTGALAGLVFSLDVAQPPRDNWIRIQQRSRELTPPGARILTPVRRSGFRLHSLRNVVGEWRDGTMQFFDPAFALAWEKRMNALDPDMLRHLRPEDWVSLGERFEAEYVVLPRGGERGLVLVAANEDWVLAETRLTPPPPLPPPPEQAVDPESWLAQERFMLEVVAPNIERNRKSRVQLRLEDAEGNALAGLPVEIRQQSLDFGIGSALHHFEPVARQGKGYHAPPVHPLELERFKEVFNYSVIGFSGKWLFLEPEPDQRYYADLDAYIEWCTDNDIRIEYHFVTGYVPEWLNKLPKSEQLAQLLDHAGDLIVRYGDRIEHWQVINERRMQNEAPEVFALFRDKLPGASLGVSHCSRFYSEREGPRGVTDMQRGMSSMEQIMQSGQKVDFFSIHAHRPFGTWWDPRTMYQVMDDFAAKGVRVHISETGISHSGKIEGGVMSGEWNEELQAEYLVRFFKVAFSHPEVDAVNFWGFGPKTWQANIGLLDDDYEPRPAFHALKKLVHETWNTRLDTRSGSGGAVPLHGFHGEYLVTVRHPDGRLGTGRFDLGADTPASQTVQVGWQVQ